LREVNGREEAEERKQKMVTIDSTDGEGDA
jgi:hypothetical protein